MEKIPNKLNFSGKMPESVPENILKVPMNRPWANVRIQDGVKSGDKHYLPTCFELYVRNHMKYQKLVNYNL